MNTKDAKIAGIKLCQSYNRQYGTTRGDANDTSIAPDGSWVLAWGTGSPRKLLDVSRLYALGWRHRHSMHEGLISAYEDFLRPRC